jgi:hypothetical protein
MFVSLVRSVPVGLKNAKAIKPACAQIHGVFNADRLMSLDHYRTRNATSITDVLFDLRLLNSCFASDRHPTRM